MEARFSSKTYRGKARQDTGRELAAVVYHEIGMISMNQQCRSARHTGAGSLLECQSKDFDAIQ